MYTKVYSIITKTLIHYFINDIKSNQKLALTSWMVNDMLLDLLDAEGRKTIHQFWPKYLDLPTQLFLLQSLKLL